MKSVPLLLESIHLIAKSNLHEELTDAEIEALATSENKIYFTPGTGSFSSEFKHSASGGYYNKDFTFSFPSAITPEQESQLNSTGAVVMKTKNGRTIVFYKNDIFSNTEIKFQIATTANKTVIKSEITSLNNL